MLYALAIENACKATFIEKRLLGAAHGKAQNLRTDHNILAMVRQAGVTPDKDQSYFLELLTYQVQVLSKYPVAKDVDTFKAFSGQAVGFQEIEKDTVEAIIVQVIAKPELISLFLAPQFTD